MLRLMRVEFGKGVSKLFIRYAVLAKEVSQTKNTKTNLSISLSRKIFTSVTNSSGCMEGNKGTHAFSKCRNQVLNTASSEIDMLKKAGTTTR